MPEISAGQKQNTHFPHQIQYCPTPPDLQGFKITCSALRLPDPVLYNSVISVFHDFEDLFLKF